MRDVLAEAYFGVDVDKKMTLMEAIVLLRRHNLINHGELAERAISVQSGVDLCDKNTPSIDLVTGVQIKSAQVTKSSNGDHYKAHIGIKTTAPMLCVITNLIEGKQYFLHIPPSAHKHLSANTISIPFGRDGMGGESQWWHHQVDNFEDLCELAK